MLTIPVAASDENDAIYFAVYSHTDIHTSLPILDMKRTILDLMLLENTSIRQTMKTICLEHI